MAVMTSVPANVYLLFCDSAGAISLFPPTGTLATSALSPIALPGTSKELTLDNHPGQEVFYVIASRWALSQSDASLDRLITEVRSGGSGCGTRLERDLAGPDPAIAARSNPMTTPRQLGALRGFDVTDHGSSPSDPGLSASSGPDGIAVLRIPIDHVAR
jgi:hypothetical protein